jgi:hypothetical protein
MYIRLLSSKDKWKYRYFSTHTLFCSKQQTSIETAKVCDSNTYSNKRLSCIHAGLLWESRHTKLYHSLLSAFENII